MDFITTLDSWDRQLLLWINHDGGPWADTFWWYYSGKVAWVAAAAAILYTLARNRRGWQAAAVVILMTLLVATLCDQVSASVIKPLVQRPRPSRDAELSALLHLVHNYHGGRYGFVSNHAANAFGMVTWLALLLRGRWLRCTLIAWAIGSCYSRLYLGVHYPGDILCGALTGVAIALLTWQLYKHIVKKLGGTDATRCAVAPYPREPWLISCSIWITVAVLAVVAVIGPNG